MKNVDNIEEKNEYTENLKINYYNFMGELNEEINNDRQKEEYANIFIELINNSSKIKCLTEEETSIIRKMLGVGEKGNTTKQDLCASLGFTYGVLERKLKSIHSKLYRRVLRGCVNLEEAFLNGDISKEEICELPIAILGELGPRINNGVWRLFYTYEIKTIGQLISYSTDEIESLCHYRIGSKSMETIVNYIHGFRLKFKDEKNKQIEYLDKIQPLDEKTNSSENENLNQISDEKKLVILKNLLEKLDTIFDTEAAYDKKMNEIMIEKQKLQVSKNEILSKISSLQTLENNEIDIPKQRKI